jgi:hypothetical protein
MQKSTKNNRGSTTYKLKRASHSEMKVSHDSSSAILEILDVVIFDDEEDEDTRHLHIGPLDHVGELQQCSTDHINEGMCSLRTHWRTPRTSNPQEKESRERERERDFHHKTYSLHS